VTKYPTSLFPLQMEEEKLPPKSLDYKLMLIQNEFTTVTKDKENTFFKSSYFDINALVKALRPVLKEYNILMRQPLVFREGKNILQTILIDMESKDQEGNYETLISEVALPDVIDPQKIGSAITYLRRYSLVTLFCLEAVDDDGETGAGRGKVELQEKKAKWQEEISNIQTVKGLADFLTKNKENEKHLLTMLGKRRKEIESN